MKKIYTLLMLSLLFISYVFAAENEDPGAEAVKMYQEGDYSGAIDIYTKMLEEGKESFSLYYNLGNNYYKQGEIGRAILNYERALLLQPGNEDARYNLTMAQRAAVDKINVLPELFLVRWYNSLFTALTADQWAYISVALFLLVLVMVMLFFYATSMSTRKTGFAVAVVALLLTGASVLFANRQYHRLTDRNTGIIMSPSVVVRGAPDNSGTELFVIHEGLKVEVLESLGSWHNIRMADGNVGWILQDAMEKI